MPNIEILERQRPVEEEITLSNDAFEQSQLNLGLPSTNPVNNIFLTSLFLGGALIYPNNSSSTESFEITNTSIDQIGLVFEYDKKINYDYANYVNQLNCISKLTITKYSLIKEILSFKSLNQSWDGYGAIPLEIESAANAIQLIDLIGEDIFCSVNEFYPNPHGTITFEWENNEKEIVSVEVGNESLSYYVEIASREGEYFNNIKINSIEIEKLKKYIKAI